MALVHGNGYGISDVAKALRRADLLGGVWARRNQRLPNSSESVTDLGGDPTDAEVASHRAGAERELADQGTRG